ncbi:transglycosylase domain-containing protein [Anaerobium acetethylicum]|uniref:Penicillin-binding protein 1A n=1 Tax=Anaerobium acetethylicum TaxID=1619234 RepID=A0A1D3TRG4_9FIRM|nr:PBP1A family penicillin-binding protein [Anaerobium acetethylicum]SCP96307.1 penicillin-binding protein, 1A family [Anaerobium acetethylicum]
MADKINWKNGKKRHRLFWGFVKLQVFLMVLALVAGAFLYRCGFDETVIALYREAVSFAEHSSEETFRSTQTSLVYDAGGNLLSTLKGEKDVYYLESEEIPDQVKDAFISIEDKKFYSHIGIDLEAIVRAAKTIIEDREITQGASTITQQLSRNVFLTHQVSWERKVEEIFIALELEKRYSKEEILEYYINNIYFANGYYGIQAASKGYFGVDAGGLSLAQITFLCAIPNNPTLYNPVDSMDDTIGRRNRILGEMLQDGKISPEDYNAAIGEPVEIKVQTSTRNNYVETYVYHCAVVALMERQGFAFRNEFGNEVEEKIYDEAYDALYRECKRNLYTKGYRIYTSIDLGRQQLLQAAVDEQLEDFTDLSGTGVYKLQGAATCIDNLTGYVVAIVGGRSQETSEYTLNRAFQSYRQPGSTIKPLIVYTPALERGYLPTTIVNDHGIKNGPENSDGKYLGRMTLRKAVEKSRNTVAWQILAELTPREGLSYLKTMDFAEITETDYVLSSAIGGLTNGVTTVEMASGYRCIENDGNFRNPTCIVKITDADGRELYAETGEETPVYKQNAARMMTDILKGVLTSGTGYRCRLSSKMPAAAKTGTTNDSKDGWFVGFTSYYTTSVWVGCDQPEKVKNLYGATYPGRIWKQYMDAIHDGLEIREFLPYVEE